MSSSPAHRPATQQPDHTATPPILICTDVYYADLRSTDDWAFELQASDGTFRCTLYTPNPDCFRVGGTYLLVAAPEPGSAAATGTGPASIVPEPAEVAR